MLQRDESASSSNGGNATKARNPRASRCCQLDEEVTSSSEWILRATMTRSRCSDKCALRQRHTAQRQLQEQRAPTAAAARWRRLHALATRMLPAKRTPRAALRQRLQRKQRLSASIGRLLRLDAAEGGRFHTRCERGPPHGSGSHYSQRAVACLHLHRKQCAHRATPPHTHAARCC